MSWPQALRVLMLCKSVSTWILLVYLKLALYMSSGLATVFLYKCSSIGVRTVSYVAAGQMRAFLTTKKKEYYW